MLEPTYRSALAHSWQLVWHHKILWIFGLLSVMFGQFGIANFVGQVLALDRNSFFAGDYSAYFTFGFWQPLFSSWSAWLFIVSFMLFAAVALLSVAAEGALIAAVSEWFHLRKTPRFAKAWHQGVKHFWRLFSVLIMQRVIMLALLLLVGYLLSRFAQVESLLNTFYTVTIFAAGFVVAFMVSAVTLFAAGYIVHDENTLGVALQKAMMLFRRHVIVSIELCIVELLFSIILAHIIFSLGVVALVPSVFLSIIATVTNFSPLITLGVLVSLFLFVVIVALVGAIFHAFIVASWIYLFMKMHHEGVASRIMHWLGLKRS